MLKSKKLWIAIVVLIALGWWVLNKGGSNQPYTARVMEMPESDFAAVAQGKIDVDGGIINVAARGGAGVYRDVYVEEGDLVEVGQILAVQEDDRERIAVRQSEASLQAARARMTTLELNQDIAQREYDRLEPLVEIDAASPKELDEAVDRLRQIEVDIVSQKASIAQSQASLESAQFQLDQRTIRAPVAGRIIEATARPGVGSSSLNVSTAFTLMPDAQKIVRADLDEAFVGSVVLGQKAKVSPDARPNETYDGEVIRVGEIFGQRTTQQGQGGGGSDKVIQVVVAVGDVPLLIGQRVMVRFLKDGDDGQ